MIFRRAEKPKGVVGAFPHLDVLIATVKKAQDLGLRVEDVFSPVPIKEVEELVSPKTSPVRFVTLSGALFGIVGGFALAIGTSVIWNIIVGGKPVTHHVPFVVVGFEALILCGAIATLLAILVFSKLPYTQFPGPAYRASFSKDEFGLWLSDKTETSKDARKLLEDAGAQAIANVGEEKRGAV